MKTKKILFTAVIAVLLIVSFTSCQFFTNSPMKGLAEKLEDTLKDAPASDVVNTIDDCTPAQKAQVLAALGQKDSEELKGLDPEEKNIILDAQVDATIDIKGILALIPSDTDSGNESGSGNSGSGDMNPEDMLTAVMASIAVVDTKATTAILDSVITNDGTIAPGVNEASVTLAAVSVIATELKTSEINITEDVSEDDLNELMSFFGGDSDGETPAAPKTKEEATAAAKAILGSDASEDTIKSVTTSLLAIQAAGGLDALMNAFGGAAGAM